MAKYKKRALKKLNERISAYDQAKKFGGKVTYGMNKPGSMKVPR